MENFASEIFHGTIPPFLWCSAKEIHGIVRQNAKPTPDQ
jgi:hypothetical protein